jgi:UDP-glucose 4-epimerase
MAVVLKHIIVHLRPRISENVPSPRSTCELVTDRGEREEGHNSINHPRRESTPLSLTCPDRRTKLTTGERLSDVYRADDRWSVAFLRCFNPIGAHESGLLDEDPNRFPNRRVPLRAKIALAIQREPNVFGSDCDTADGTAVRDYTHAMDIAEGYTNARRYCL